MSEKSSDHLSLNDVHRQQRRERLKTLLTHRDNLGTQWAEHVSHNRRDAEILAYELGVIEHALANNWPHLVEAHLPDWLERDARLLHSEATPLPGCSLCTATVSESVRAA